MKGLPPLHRRAPRVDSPWFDPDAFDDPERRRQAVGFHRDGFVLVRDLVPRDLLEQARAETDPLFDPAVDDGPRSRSRCQDAWRESQATRRIACWPAITDLVADLYGRRPFPFQTLTFRHGSNQQPHADTLHFNSIPPRFLCAAWVALEDVEPDSGPLCYVPGSHRLPELRSLEIGSHPLDVDYRGYEEAVATMVERAGLEMVTLTARAGDVFIWSANLVHGGRPVSDPTSTRWSQVTHYYFEGCVYYAPRYSDPLGGALALRDVVDVGTGRPVPHRSDRHDVIAEPFDDIRSRVMCPAWWPERGTRAELHELRRAARRVVGAAARSARRRLRR